MCTVGYGDLVPRSHLGRFIGVVACIIGMLLVSLIVVSLAVVTEFTNEEKKAYSKLKKLQADDNALNKAANVLVDVLKLRKLVTQKPTALAMNNKIMERFVLLTQLKKNVSVFKNDFKIASSFALPIDEMLKALEDKLKRDIEILTTSIKKISNVENELSDIREHQDYVKRKMNVIIDRQELIAKYIVEINNENYKKQMNKKFSTNNRSKSEVTFKHPKSVAQHIVESYIMNNLPKTVPQTADKSNGFKTVRSFNDSDSDITISEHSNESEGHIN
jgi:hypothetical protein